jgi:hypothetical protein
MTLQDMPDYDADMGYAQRIQTSNRELPENISEYEEQIRDAVIWHLLVMEDVDDPALSVGTRITGQFTPQSFRHDVGSQLHEAGGFSRTNPLVQWVGGALESISFEARLWSEHSEDQTTRDKLEVLKLLKKALPPLNRPPLTRFFWGNAIPGGMPCFVESLGGIQYDEIRPDGSLRGATLSITLKKFTPFTVERTHISPMERTPIHEVRRGETYEMIAYHRYGDPMLGVPLRQQNPRYPMKDWAPTMIADLEPGDIVKLYPKRDLTDRPIRPQCHIFDENNRESADLRRYYFMTRAAKIGIIPKR